MKAILLDADYGVTATVEAEPYCGEDFCDSCGDCLRCSDAPCHIGSPVHRWYVYADQVEAFRQRAA